MTICAKNKEEFFGKIENDKMILNSVGEIIENQWLWLAKQYDYVQLGEYIIMPNHVHGILIIENNNVGTRSQYGRDRSRPVSTGN